MTPLICLTDSLIILALLIAAVLMLSWLLSGFALRRITADQPDTSYRETGEFIQFYSRDGLTLEGWFLRAPQASQQRTIIICSGYSQTMVRDLWLINPLEQNGLSVLLFNWRGRGGSEGRRSTFGHDEIYDLQGAIDFVQANGVKQIGIISFSMGASVALRLNDPRINCIVADSPMFDIPSALREAFQHKVGVLAGVLVSVVTVMIALRLRRNPSKIQLSTALEEQTLPPVLLITGGQDSMLSEQKRAAIIRTLSDDYTNWHLSDAGHRNAYTIDRETYVSTVIAFLEQWLAGGRNRV